MPVCRQTARAQVALQIHTAGLEVKGSFVRHKLKSGSWGKGYSLAFETWRTQPSTASLGLPGQTRWCPSSPEPGKDTYDSKSKALPQFQEAMIFSGPPHLLRRKSSQVPFRVRPVSVQRQNPQYIRTLNYTVCTWQSEGRTGPCSVLKRL